MVELSMGWLSRSCTMAMTGLILGLATPAIAKPDMGLESLMQWSKNHLILEPLQVVERLDEADPDFSTQLETRHGLLNYQAYLGSDNVVEQERIQYRPRCFAADKPGCAGVVHFAPTAGTNAARLIELLWGADVLEDFMNAQLMLTDTTSGEQQWYQGKLYNYETWHYGDKVNANFSIVSKRSPQAERIKQYQACLKDQCRAF